MASPDEHLLNRPALELFIQSRNDLEFGSGYHYGLQIGDWYRPVLLAADTFRIVAVDHLA